MIKFARFAVAALVSVLLLARGDAGFALPGDKDQPIHIESEEAIRDEKNGLTRYQGKVRIRQGSMRISADLVTLYHLESPADKIVARGKPARMQLQHKPDEEPIHAEGELIEYYKEQQRVHISHRAKLEQGGSTVRSDSIEYFIDRELVKAVADESVSGEAQGRVRVVIPPSRLEQDETGED